MRSLKPFKLTDDDKRPDYTTFGEPDWTYRRPGPYEVPWRDSTGTPWITPDRVEPIPQVPVPMIPLDIRQPPIGQDVFKPRAKKLDFIPVCVESHERFRPLLAMCRKYRDFGPLGVMADWLEENGCVELAHAFRYCWSRQHRPFYQRVGPIGQRWMWRRFVKDDEQTPSMLPEVLFDVIRQQRANWTVVDNQARFRTFFQAMLELAFGLNEMRKLAGF